MISETDARELGNGFLVTCLATDVPCGWKRGALFGDPPPQPHVVRRWRSEAHRHALETGHDVKIVQIGHSVIAGRSGT